MQQGLCGRHRRTLDQVLRTLDGIVLVDTAEAAAGTGLVAAADAVLADVLAAALLVVGQVALVEQVLSGLLADGDVLEDVGGKRLVLDIDVPAG